MNRTKIWFAPAGALLGALALVFAAAFGVFAQEVPAETETEVTTPPFDYTFTRVDRLVGAQACIHEATWAGAERTGDCGGIIQVVMTRRRPARLVRGRRRRAETFEEALARTMPRFYSGVTTRSWTRFLPSGPLRDDPPGWPYAYPARHHDDAWLAVNRRVSAYMTGAEPLPCSPSPGRWFGRATDGDALAATLERGHWGEAACGEGEALTRNAFLYRVTE